jgi:hypothetical protein
MEKFSGDCGKYRGALLVESVGYLFKFIGKIKCKDAFSYYSDGGLVLGCLLVCKI